MPKKRLRTFAQPLAKDCAVFAGLSATYSRDVAGFVEAHALLSMKNGWKLSFIPRKAATGCGDSQGDWEVDMANDDRDILELLKDELSFIEQGGYGRSVRTPWKPTSAFQDSLTCINYGYPYRAHPCNECHLIDFVDSEHQRTDIPCHHIPLDEAGETIEDLEATDNEAKLERKVRDWLRAKIKQIEEERAAQAMAGCP